nr:site-specific DNA-methyltransferase [Prevotella sp.]
MAVRVTSNISPASSALSLVPKSEIVFRPVNQYDGTGIKRLYHADNLDVLNYLINDKKVCGNIDLVYIDPPYNTGGAFETRDFKLAYDDKYTTDGYLRFMRVRLKLLHTLLSEKGSIYVHLDSNMVFHVKILMDDIFGEKNFRGMITRKKCKSKNFTRKTYGNISDYILFYSKSDSAKWNRPYDQWDDEKVLKEYPFIEEGTGRRHKRVPCHAPGTRNGATGGPWRGMMPPEGKHWQYTPEKLDEMDAKGEIYWSSNGNPRRKVYLDQSKGVPVQDIWLDYLDVNNQNTCLTGYPTEKNLDMLKRIIETSSNPGDLVLDCFAGSGTTLVAAEELGRQWIGVDIGEEAIKIIQDRFVNGTKPIGDYVSRRKKKNDFASQSLFDLDFDDEKDTSNSQKTASKVQYQMFEEI